MKRRIVPRPLEKQVVDQAVLTFEDFIVFMTLYWRYIRSEVARKGGKKLSMATLLLMMVDYVRLRLINFII